ncbi:MAG: regulatory iron-sulfur-containing complex subunit RicT [Myxococcota bacterium]
MADPFLLPADAPLDLAAPPTSSGEQRLVVGVVFTVGGVAQDHDAGTLELVAGDAVLVETPEGLRQGTVAIGTHARHVVGPLRRVVRKVTEQDARAAAQLAAKEKLAMRFCLLRIRALKLDMKLVKVEGGLAGARMTFYFASDGRVDFRELVSNLARELRCRVEMRQIGVRDAARLVGGIGVCGRELCCSSWMKKFVPVSIKMAKDQGLSLNPQKVSGQCGRLLCCLTYEQETYKNLRAGLPKVGKSFRTPDGRVGKVRDVDVLRGRARVWFESGVEEFTREQIAAMAGALPPSPPEPDDDEETPSPKAPPPKKVGKKKMPAPH